MTICTVYYKENGNMISETVYSISAAKKIMKMHPGSTGEKIKVYANGDWVPCGPIVIKGSNKSFIANTRMTKKSY